MTVFVPPSKVPNIKIIVYDPGDLENKVKVKLMTYNKRSFHYASWYKYQVCMSKDLWTFVYPIGYNGKI